MADAVGSFRECSIAFQFPSATLPVRMPQQSWKKLQTRCMAHPRRRLMVAQQIRREVGDMLIKDIKLKCAVMPESALGADMYLTSVTTITDVEVTRDLSLAKIFISVYGDERGKEIAIEGLKAQAKYVRMQLGRRMRLRVTPEVRFIYDDSFEQGRKVIKLLDKSKAEQEREQEAKARGEIIDYSKMYDDESSSSTRSSSDVKGDVAGLIESVSVGGDHTEKQDFVDDEPDSDYED